MNEKDFIYSKDIQLSGIVKWTAPSNIAIVKYWGKLDNQIPQIDRFLISSGFI